MMVDINQASVEDLKQITGIGQVTAEKVVNYRTEHGEFASLEGLQQIPGIGAKTVELFKEELSLEGEAKVEKKSEPEVTEAKKQLAKIEFDPQEYGLSNLGEVHLVGEMNDWDPADKSYALNKQADGSWENEFALEAGMEYKIMYDSTSWEENKDIGDQGANLVISK